MRATLSNQSLLRACVRVCLRSYLAKGKIRLDFAIAVFMFQQHTSTKAVPRSSPTCNDDVFLSAKSSTAGLCQTQEGLMQICSPFLFPTQQNTHHGPFHSETLNSGPSSPPHSHRRTGEFVIVAPYSQTHRGIRHHGSSFTKTHQEICHSDSSFTETHRGICHSGSTAGQDP